MIKIKMKNDFKKFSKDISKIISLEKSRQSEKQESKRRLVTHLQDTRRKEND